MNDETKKLLRTKKKEALDAGWELEAQRGFKRRYEHPEWKAIEAELTAKVHEALGLPLDLKNIFLDEAPEEGEQREEAGATGEGVKVPASGAVLLKDEHAKPMDVPHKWLRIPINPGQLPELVLSAGASEAELAAASRLASDALTGAVGAAVQRWANSDEGKLWCYRRAQKVYPSQYKDWNRFLEKVRSGDAKLALPNIALAWNIKLSRDWLSKDRLNLHIALENVSQPPVGAADETDEAVFQVDLSLTLPRVLHAPLRLGRVKASYRYNQYLEYPATGYNGGVEVTHEAPQGTLRLLTTWAPRYTQPRVVPVSYKDVNPNIRALSQPDGLSGLSHLETELERWFEDLPSKVDLSAGLDAGDTDALDKERAGFDLDRNAWRNEIDCVKAGLRILRDSKAAWDELKQRGQQKNERAVVYEAWLEMNEAMANLLQQRLGDDSGAWRLFQIAFVVANLPSIASRSQAYRSEFLKNRDDTVTLLYFATGGGKSEAFFGLLVFTLFFDRLRGKHTGVTAMLRYPLRLLTIQQAQRCAKVLAQAELVKHKYGVAGDPLAIGFWVGSGGSPNSPSDPGVAFVPDISEKDATATTEQKLVDEDVKYRLQKEAWNKIPRCPFCGHETALRQFKVQGGTLAHVCTNSKCHSNRAGWSPLPFYICDTDIYDFAPPVILGTVDKLALIGQSYKTLRRIYGMFGAAPWRHTATGRLRMPLEARDFERGPVAEGCQGLYPAYADGVKVFLDPFPSLLIQDEAHLLDESLGTFAGLFESALDAILAEMAKPLHELVAYEPDGVTRRRSKVIAASATVSEPQRQMEHLYQRVVPAMQFPHPGQSLYESFYAAPAEPPAEDAERLGLKESSTETWARWNRVYVAFMTNGRPHTATTVAVLSNFHTVVSELLLDLTSGEVERIGRARDRLLAAVSNRELASMYRSRVSQASASHLATLIDLHRIALTYVTNKKGGDQIMAAEFEETRKRHAERLLPITDLPTRLITGSVAQGEIQQTVQDAQTRPKPGKPFDDLSTVLRSIIATSAISHGVDVEELNSMFFAGMPSDTAEYIQASSRVGRTHVGFVVLIPTPQRRRDRYIVEVFDSYHRFLERMVQPAAIDRWADKAIARVLPSLIQAYLAGVAYVRDVTRAEPDKKKAVDDLAWIPTVNKLYRKPATQKPLVDGICGFIERAIGLDNPDFAPGGREHYQRMVRDKVYALLARWSTDDLLAEQSLKSFFDEQRSSLDRPMTSLRDVDEAGDIHFGNKDLNGRRLDSATARRVMVFIRHGVAEGTEAGD
ncbi:helicase-related protein [Ideonella sp. DXS22W]|uniref:Helicase-related protein n=1 Tax=Pseudaquabacterium inlustre TaxID=2984192 RepID=A0ABU9CBB1_9BURK